MAFYDHGYPRVAAYFYRRILCPYTTAELTAETFARVWASVRSSTPRRARRSVGPWDRGEPVPAVELQGRHDPRRRARLAIQTPVLVLEDLEHIESLVDLGSFRGQLYDALEHLTPRLREAVVLRVALDLPYDEVAARPGCTGGRPRARVCGLDVLLAAMEGDR